MASGDLSSLSLFPATAEQTIESRKRTYVHWNRGKTLAEYLQSDVVLEGFENSVDHKMTTWSVKQIGHVIHFIPELIYSFVGCWPQGKALLL